jgi:hypothetical protein
MGAKHEARELAYNTWRDCGQNLSETERRLSRDHGLPVSRQTLTDWCTKYDWKERAARVEIEASRQQTGTDDQTFLAALLAQKERYEKYFESLALGQVDNQATFAYSRLLKSLVEIRQGMAAIDSKEPDIDRPKLFMEDLKFVAESLREVDPEGLKVFARNFDAVVQRFKAQLAA